jgi:hypothetical protein
MSPQLIAFSLCTFAFLSASPTALAVSLKIKVTPAYVAAHPEEFQVKTDASEGAVRFTFIRFVDRRVHRIADIDVRKGGRTLVACQIRPEERADRIEYSLTVSPDLAQESVFSLRESKISTLNDEEIPELGGTVYRFRLADYLGDAAVESRKAGAPDREGGAPDREEGEPDR